MKTSIIITVYNRPETLIACLRALVLSPVRNFNVVISDDGSAEASVRKMKSAFDGFPFPLKYVRQEDQGFRLAAARNNGIRNSTGDYIISIDCDIILLPTTIETHLQSAERGCFLVGNRAYVSEALTKKLSGNVLFGPHLLEMAWEASDKRRLRRVHRQFKHYTCLRKIGLARKHKPKLLGCHFSLFREDIDRVNGFDEHYVGWGLEDDDFSLRLQQAGIKGKSLILAARALHLCHPSAKSSGSHRSASPNKDYFRRKDIPTFCAKGLVAKQ